MYTAVYARVSTGMQAIEGTSLDGQVELCMKKAREHNVALSAIKVYKEEGFSGEDMDRPAMNRLRQDIGAGLISQVVITHPDRLSRDLTDKLFICRELESRNVELLFVDTEYKNTPEGQLFFNLISVIAQYELSLIKKRTIRGRLKAVEKDKRIMPMRVPPYGYDYAESRLVINETEAQFVRLIYQWYVCDHMTMREIGNQLTEMGAEPKRAETKSWSASSIQKILRSEIYIGRYYYNRRSTRKLKGERTKNGAPKKTYTIRDEKEWILVEVPAIIDERLFRLAQEQRGKNTKNAGHVKHEYLLKSLLRCGHCGRRWEATTYSGRLNKLTGTRESYTCYRCPNRNPKRFGHHIERCSGRSIRAEVLDDYVWSLVMKVISDPQAYAERLTCSKESLMNELLLESESIGRLLQAKDKEAGKIKLMFRKAFIDAEEMEQEFRSLQAEKNALQEREQACLERLSQLRNESVSVIEDTTIERIIRELRTEEKRHIIQSLVHEFLISREGAEIRVTAIGFLDELITGLREERETGAES
ncbi:recombinase family protein [Paenibacillus montanisoli]|uniref:Recombinase family protein n=1 Tax=Paenibacillus montanisoli TaxID=2081970 RepID=A0A328U2C0_9BACL|nr:recombinase family protein [Paenibacillus montanisoli]RAP76789.1 recombinase family protein [Paenibacillus montanisoli]